MTGKMIATAVVIRTFNNPHIAKQVRSFLASDVGKVFVVVNAGPDKDATIGYLGRSILDSRIQVIEMFSGYSWSNALNRACMAIQIENVKRNQRMKPAIQFILNASVEALFERSHIEAMLDVATDDRLIGVVGTSFHALQDNNPVELGPSYRHPRNTGMLVRLEAFGKLFGGFDAWCDDMGGMEDLDLILRMRALSDLQVRMLPLGVPLIVGKNYHQPTKEVAERKAMDAVIGRWRSFFPERTEERERIESIIQDMRLEEK